MKTHERWAIYPLLLFSLLTSVIAICRTHPRTELDFDYIGLIVGILALLVTMLIGWQIWNLIDFDRRVKNKINEDRKKLQREILDEVKLRDENLKKWFEICIEERIKKERNRTLLERRLNGAKIEFEKGQYERAFRSFCDIAVRSHKAQETDVRDEALYMAEIVINATKGTFQANERAFRFYDSIKSELQEIGNERALNILNFIEEHYSNLSNITQTTK